MGPPASLGAGGRPQIRFVVPGGAEASVLASLAGGTILVERRPAGARGRRPTRALHMLTGWALDRGCSLDRPRGRAAEPRGRLPGADGGRSVRRYLRQVSAEQRVYWRNVPSAFFTFFLPILFLVFLGLFGRDRIVDGRPYAVFFVPGMLGMAVVMTTFAGLAITLVIRRERGMLKRVRGTPLPPLVYLGALVDLDRRRAGAGGARGAVPRRRRLRRAAAGATGGRSCC